MVGVLLGVVVLAVSIGFVVLMMVTEWSQPSGAAQPLPMAEAMAQSGPPARRAAKRRPAPKRRAKAPAKKK